MILYPRQRYTAVPKQDRDETILPYYLFQQAKFTSDWVSWAEAWQGQNKQTDSNSINVAKNPCPYRLPQQLIEQKDWVCWSCFIWHSLLCLINNIIKVGWACKIQKKCTFKMVFKKKQDIWNLSAVKQTTCIK